MYSACLFCHQQLGTNEQIEAFPVGKRLAFDAAKGRLWVVCPHCGRWNLAPLDERWEAIEQCERLFRGTRIRVSTDNIGLAKLRDSTELVRVGDPLRPEFAAWRYTDHIVRRRRRTMALVGAGVLGATALGVGLVSAGIGGGAFSIINAARQVWKKRRDRRVVFRQAGDDGPVNITAAALDQIRLRIDHRPADPGILALELPQGEGLQAPAPALHFSGNDRQTVTAIALARHNRLAGRPEDIRAAVERLDRDGNPFVDGDSSAAWNAMLWRWGTPVRPYPSGGSRHILLKALDPPVRLALEMGAHEEQERVFLSAHLSVLEHAWKDAEAIAAIADDLLLPDWVRQRFPR